MPVQRSSASAAGFVCSAAALTRGLRFAFLTCCAFSAFCSAFFSAVMPAITFSAVCSAECSGAACDSSTASSAGSSYVATNGKAGVRRRIPASSKAAARAGSKEWRQANVSWYIHPAQWWHQWQLSRSTSLRPTNYHPGSWYVACTAVVCRADKTLTLKGIVILWPLQGPVRVRAEVCRLAHIVEPPSATTRKARMSALKQTRTTSCARPYEMHPRLVAKSNRR
jgi:hypothetical protein